MAAATPVFGMNSQGPAQARAVVVAEKVRIRIGPRRGGGRGGETRYIDLDPKAAAQIVEQLGLAMSKALGKGQQAK